MFKLNQLQKYFQEYLIEDDHIIYPAINDHIQGRLDIYYDAYRSRLIEVLSTDYAHCEKLIEYLFPNGFAAAALGYLQAHPSRHFSVRYFGKTFPDFLAHTSPYKDTPYLGELADFEWSLLHALDAANAPALNLDTLKNISPEKWADLVFELHPSAHYKIYEWAIAPLWKSIPSGNPLITQQKTVCLFWRKNITTLFEVLPLTHQIFYQGILAKKTFGEICEDLFEITPEQDYESVPATAVGILQYWIEQHVIVATNAFSEERQEFKEKEEV